MIRRLLAALVVLASGCFAPAPLVAQAADSVQAFAFAGAATLDSVAARSRRDTTVLTIRNGPAVVIWRAPATRWRSLRDSLRVWCRAPACAWDWDELVPMPDSSDAALSLDAPASFPWGVEAVGAPAAWAMGARGQGVIVTSLDSGIDPTHPGYTVAGGWNAVARSDTGWSDNLGACNGHGTHVMGTAIGKSHGVAPDARGYGVKVFQLVGGQCLSYASDQAAGIVRAVAAGSRCINISISGNNSYTMNATVTNARNAGVVVVRANGNSNATPPGGTPLELQTASLNSGLTRSYFSNYGPSPQTDLAAPGEGVVSTMPGGGYAGKNGTSMAAPHVCGVAALVMSLFPTVPVDSIELAMRRSAIPIGAPVPNDYTGWGLVRADRSIAWLQGGVAIAARAIDTIPATAPLVRTCKPVVALGAWSATASAPWLRVTTTADYLCYSIDPALLPPGSGPLVGTITTRSP